MTASGILVLIGVAQKKYGGISKLVSCSDTSKIFENSLVYSLLPPILYLKSIFVFLEVNFSKAIILPVFVTKKYICKSFVAHALS